MDFLEIDGAAGLRTLSSGGGKGVFGVNSMPERIGFPFDDSTRQVQCNLSDVVTVNAKSRLSQILVTSQEHNTPCVYFREARIEDVLMQRSCKKLLESVPVAPTRDSDVVVGG
jgi:hypothetical protein